MNMMLNISGDTIFMQVFPVVFVIKIGSVINIYSSFVLFSDYD